MNFFNKDIFKYGLHDTEINNIYCVDSKFVLLFNSGIYYLDSDCKEINRSPACKMCIYIDNLNVSNIFQYIEITKIYRNKCKEMSYNQFMNELLENPFQIILDYYSEFAKSLLFRGYISKYKIEFIISDIKDINFMFEE